jgi:hypothetical protein
MRATRPDGALDALLRCFSSFRGSFQRDCEVWACDCSRQARTISHECQWGFCKLQNVQLKPIERKTASRDKPLISCRPLHHAVAHRTPFMAGPLGLVRLKPPLLQLLATMTAMWWSLLGAGISANCLLESAALWAGLASCLRCAVLCNIVSVVVYNQQQWRYDGSSRAPGIVQDPYSVWILHPLAGQRLAVTVNRAALDRALHALRAHSNQMMAHQGSCR